MPRFFMAASNISRGIAIISGSNFNHISVLRMKIGDKLVVCDGEGSEYECAIKSIRDGYAEASVLNQIKGSTEPDISATVLAAMPKGERSDLIVQKCAEVGADSILFFISDRSVSRPDPHAMNKKITRWQKIAESAAKQSGRSTIPRVFTVGGLSEALDMAKRTELRLMMYEEGESRRPIREVLREAPPFKTVSILTGPEGGFAKHETEIAELYGLTLCSMGPRILRCETAPVVALSCVMYESGNL